MKKGNNWKYYIINTLIILFIFCIALIVNKVYPFGDYDLANYDAYYQYKPFLYNFINSIRNGSLYSYSFLNGLGAPTVFNYVYYLSSPLNLICLFFRTPEQMFFSVIVFKIFIGAIISFFYFNKKNNKKYVSIICSASYIYSAWFVSNYFNIMWLDAFIVFPLLHYGLEKLINENKVFIYIFSLSYIMISNFYMAFIVCLYTLVYYLFCIFIKKDLYKNKIKNFDLIFISTIVVFLISFFYIFDVYSSLIKIHIYVSNIVNDFSKINVLYLIKSLFSGVSYVSMTPVRESIVNISSSLIMVISYFYYFINKKITKKEKIIHGLVTIFIILLICSKSLNYIANGFHIPVGYHYRYSFIITFYFINIFCRNCSTIENKIDKKICFVNLVLLVILIVLLFTNSIDFKLFLFNFVLLMAYGLWVLLYDNNKYHYLLLLVIFIGELIFSVSNSINFSSKKVDNNYYSYDSSNFRNDSSKQSGFVLNSNLYSNSSDITSFSSMQYLDAIDLVGYLGCSNDGKASIAICDNSTFFDMIFNIKNDRYNLNKVFAVNNNILSFKGWKRDFMYNQNYLSELMVGIDNQFVLADDKSRLIDFDNGKYKYVIDDFVEDRYFIVYDNNVSIVKYGDIKYYLTLYNSYGSKVKNRDFEIITYNGGESRINIYKENSNSLEETYEYLKDGEIHYTLYRDDLIEGNINVKSNQLIFTSIPYDEDWEAFVDGRKVNTVEILNSLLAIPCDEGNHTVKLQYKRKNIISVIISVVSLISIIVIIIIRRKCIVVVK